MFQIGEVEERTGLGGGFNERENIEYRHHDSDSEEYDDFGRKKKKFRGGWGGGGGGGGWVGWESSFSWQPWPSFAGCWPVPTGLFFNIEFGNIS